MYQLTGSVSDCIAHLTRCLCVTISRWSSSVIQKAFTQIFWTHNRTETTGTHTIELLKYQLVICLFILPLYKEPLALRTIPSVVNSETLNFINSLHELFPPQETPPIFLNSINLLKLNGYVMHEQFNIQQLYALPTLYLCVLYLSENKQRLVPLTA